MDKKDEKEFVAGLSDILGGEFTKMDELVGKDFKILSYKPEIVQGYRTPVVQYEIEIDGETNTYSSFSTILSAQLEAVVKRMKEQDIKFPITLSLISTKSKKSGNTYLSFVPPKA